MERPSVIATCTDRKLGFYQGIKQLPVKIRLLAPSLMAAILDFAIIVQCFRHLNLTEQAPCLGGHLADIKTLSMFQLTYALIH